LAISREDNVDKGESEYEDEEPIEMSHTSITTNEVF